MASIDERIAELEQRIAEKKAYQRMYRPNRNMAAWDYVAEGDRSGYDKIDASEAAYHTMLRQQEQQNAILKAQQEFTARENALNRAVTLAGIRANSDKQSKASIEALEKELSNLIVTKDTLDAQGKDSRATTARIEQIYREHPEIERPEIGEYDPETDVNYVLAKSGEMNYMDNAGENELEDMLESVKNYRTPEAAKERVRLEREIIKRNKAAQFKEQLDKDIANYWKTGIMSDLMLQLEFEEAGVSGNRHLLQGKKIHRRPKKKGGNTPAPRAPKDT